MMSVINIYFLDVTKGQVVEFENWTEGSKVWMITNKYYHAQVQLKPLDDSRQLPDVWEHRVEAHVIYITEAEVCVHYIYISCKFILSLTITINS